MELCLTAKLSAEPGLLLAEALVHLQTNVRQGRFNFLFRHAAACQLANDFRKVNRMDEASVDDFQNSLKSRFAKHNGEQRRSVQNVVRYLAPYHFERSRSASRR